MAVNKDLIKRLNEGNICMVGEFDVPKLREMGFVVKVEESREEGSYQLERDYYAALPFIISHRDDKKEWN